MIERETSQLRSLGRYGQDQLLSHCISLNGGNMNQTWPEGTPANALGEAIEKKKIRQEVLSTLCNEQTDILLSVFIHHFQVLRALNLDLWTGYVHASIANDLFGQRVGRHTRW